MTVPAEVSAAARPGGQDQQDRHGGQEGGGSEGDRAPRSGWLPVAGPVVLWAGLVALAAVRGAPWRAEWKLRAAPLAGFINPHVSVGLVVAALLGIVGVLVLPRWASRARWRTVLAGTCLVAAAWGCALGLTRGPAGLDRGLASEHEYPAVVAQVDEIGVGEFVRTFSTEPVLRQYPIHVQGHPVGTPLAFVGLDRLGLAGPGWAAAVVIAMGASTAAAVLITVRELVDEGAARRLAPFLALAPTAVWAVASADAVFAAVAAWAIAAAALACRPDGGRRRAVALGLASGVLWGVGLHLTYGLAPVALVAVVVVVRQRRWDVAVSALVGLAAVFGLFAAWGFWWFDGLAATHIRYLQGIAELRPRGVFTVLGNPAAWAVAAGPAVFVAAARVRDRRLWWLAGSALAALAVANLSGLSKGEVERIWLPYTPWVLVLTAGLAVAPQVLRQPHDPSAQPRPVDAWPPIAVALLASQVAVALAVELIVKTPW